MDSRRACPLRIGEPVSDAVTQPGRQEVFIKKEYELEIESESKKLLDELKGDDQARLAQ